MNNNLFGLVTLIGQNVIYYERSLINYSEKARTQMLCFILPKK